MHLGTTLLYKLWCLPKFYCQTSVFFETTDWGPRGSFQTLQSLLNQHYESADPCEGPQEELAHPLQNQIAIVWPPAGSRRRKLIESAPETSFNISLQSETPSFTCLGTSRLLCIFISAPVGVRERLKVVRSRCIFFRFKRNC